MYAVCACMYIVCFCVYRRRLINKDQTLRWYVLRKVNFCTRMSAGVVLCTCHIRLPFPLFCSYQRVNSTGIQFGSCHPWSRIIWRNDFLSRGDPIIFNFIANYTFLASLFFLLLLQGSRTRFLFFLKVCTLSLSNQYIGILII